MNNSRSFHFHVPPQNSNGGKTTYTHESSIQERFNDPYEQLVALLNERERNRLDMLEEMLKDQSNRANIISEVLPEAIARRGLKDSRMNKAILPHVMESLQTLFRKKPQLFIDALFPIIGTTIRKSISSSIAGILQNISQGLEHAFTLRGLRWRLEAWRTGRSFAEVVLSHTIAYRVEQVFLIHRETGILLEHLALEEGTAQDPQIVSSMLSAIRDFVRDSFSMSPDETLERIRVGDLTVFIEQGPQALIAAAVRGEPPPQISDILRIALENVHKDLRVELAEFSGDVSPFILARPILEECLIQKDRERKKGLGIIFWILLVSILAAMGYGAYTYGKFVYGNYKLQKELDAQLNAEPGFQLSQVRINIFTGEASLVITRDALARQIDQILRERGLNPDHFKLTERLVVSMDPKMIEQRVFEKLSPIPEGVNIQVIGDVLYVSGRARDDFIQRIERSWPAVMGLSGINTSNLENLDAELLAERKKTQEQLALELQRKINEIQNVNILFDVNQPNPREDQLWKIASVANDFKQCLEIAERIGREVMLVIVGHTDPTGQLVENDILGNTRANRVLSMLLDQGLHMQNLDTRGVGPAVNVSVPEGINPNDFRRRVSFRVQQASLIGRTSDIFASEN